VKEVADATKGRDQCVHIVIRYVKMTACRKGV
jgi:hypothetical protein